MRRDRGPVLITGCSSGIGRATASRLVRQGHSVYATARRPETLAELRAAGCRILSLDLTDEASMRDAVATIKAERGHVRVLVNNAGYAEICPAELLATDRMRRQFETNLFGPWRLCQLVLPGMREAGGGRIVNVGSIADRCPLPLWAGYVATKHALAGLTDVLRMELAAYGVRVVLVEPGFVRTNFVAAINDNLTGHAADEPSGASYDSEIAGFRAMLGHVADRLTPGEDTGAGDRRGRLRGWLVAAVSGDADVVARAIVRAVTAPRPRARYQVPFHARLSFTARAFLPDRGWDAVLRRLFLGPAVRRDEAIRRPAASARERR